jgi:aspartyl aminopeptidase
MSSPSRALSQQFIDFVTQTGSPYHSVAACKRLLTGRGFKQLHERAESWNIEHGGKYFITRNHSEIFAFAVGSDFAASTGGLVMVGAHSDSPCLRLRPKSNQKSEGHLRLGVATYGGGLWYTWFDRPLGLAGKIIVNGKEERLIHIPRPVCVIPSLAIHLQSAEERKAFDVNPENHLMPIVCSASPQSGEGKHSAELLDLIASEACCQPGEITDVDICLMDAIAPSFVGAKEEFISSPRIDNLLSTWACFSALSEVEPAGSKDILIAASFDHEEVGSNSATGADSTTASGWVDRILESLKVTSASHRGAISSRSILISADCAHATHPNYPAKHQSEHKVAMNGGIVFKTNCNQRYSTTCTTTALARAICEKANVKYQDFVVRNDSPCGSTIGPILSAILGIRAIDIGAPQWAMHSCRETCGASDVEALQIFCKSAFQNFRSIDSDFVSM